MNSRRNFMVMSAAAAAATLIPVAKAEAQSPAFPSNVIYTESDSGIWSKKAATHLPQVEMEGDEAVIRTFHPMTKEHYIVRHTLVDMDGNVIGGKTFANTDKKAISRIKVPAGSKGKKFYATSFCNEHDFWVKEITL